MKGYFAFPKAPALLEPHHQIVYCHIQDTRWGGSYPSVEKQPVYSTAPADWTIHKLMPAIGNKKSKLKIHFSTANSLEEGKLGSKQLCSAQKSSFGRMIPVMNNLRNKEISIYH